MKINLSHQRTGRLLDPIFSIGDIIKVKGYQTFKKEVDLIAVRFFRSLEYKLSDEKS